MLQVKHLLDEKGRGIYAIAPDETVRAALRMMAERGCGALLVMKGDALVGVISERDYARKVVLNNRTSNDTTVADVMTTAVVSVSPEDSVDTCMRLCTDSRVRHLPVLEGNRVLGVLSIGDLVKAVISEQGEQIEQLHRYIAG
ncbi:MAG: CBS domain-containing protein [Dokdonella sp.]|uniref:CBS domain-containing protein n=1 Tax=Dokdonella sp. TaxID=2291710 RepID=UPI0025BD4092|nr:CBS domain-containing protein [Dokdonella sp.]MBX3700232.1 CBS domain-containing protein [Dokdonella sp.]